MTKRQDEPYAINLDPKKCNAKTRSNKPCKAYSMPNGRCRLHGGKSTGPKTKEGLERSKRANYKHGFYSQESKEIRKALKELMNDIEKRSKDLF